MVLSLAVAAAGDLTGAPEAASPSATQADWPQYRGPNRDNLAVNCPKLLSAWPKEGPPLAWKSELIPGWYQGGCSGPVVADGKVFVYSTWKHPLGGGDLYKPITPDVLANAGWLADLPADLSKKIEEARTSPKRPKTTARGAYFPWWGTDVKEKDKQRDEYLAKKPELDKYIKDFIATLAPEEAGKYGDYARKRLCMTPDSVYGEANGFTQAALAKLSKLEGVGFATCRECARKVAEATGTGYPLFFHLDSSQFFDAVWKPCFTRSDVLVCLDAKTGKTLWKKDFPLDAEALASLQKTGFGSASVLGVCATPAVSNGKCYFAGAAGLYCVSAKDGELLWKVKRKAEHASPLVVSGVVYQCGAAYNADTGALLWKTPLWKEGSQGCYGPTSAVIGGKMCILGYDGGIQVCAFDLQTGKDIWKLKYPQPWTVEVELSGDVLVANGATYKITPTGIEPTKTFVDFPGMSFGLNWIIYQDHLYQYIFTGEGSRKTSKADGLCCWDLKTGELKWAYRGPTCTWDTDYSPSILADGKIISPFGSGGSFMSVNDGVAMYQATPEKYTLLGSFKPDLVPWTPMAFAGGKLFVRTEVGISCYDLTEK
jgi:outer membrane protein assembly factor BamB